MKRIAVIGGGISGLSAAFSLQKRAAGAQIEYTIYEASGSFGGVIRSEKIEGCLVEAGPDSFLTEKSWAAELCHELGLGEQLISSNDAERKTYIVVKNGLVPIPDGMMFMVPTRLRAVFSSTLFSAATKLRILREWFYKPPSNSPEATVADFVERHYGQEMVERLADPLLSGVYGGSADELSLQAVLPRFAELEKTYGSLGKGILATRKNRLPDSSKPLFTSLKGGMQQMVEALLRRIPVRTLRPNTAIESIRRESHKWLLICGGRTEEYDAAIVATPAYAAAKMLADHTELAVDLAAIPYTSSVTAGFIYDQSVRSSLPPGFGVLVPRSEKRRILAVTFVHNKFPHRAPQDRAVIRCFLGGSRHEEVLSKSDDEIVSIVGSELRDLLSIKSAPVSTRIYRWRNAMAQYVVGHNARVERIRGIVASLHGLDIAGNAYSGIGVPDCVRSGTEAVSKILGDLAIT